MPPPPRRTARSWLRDLPDHELLVALSLVWPAFLALVVRTILRGETFGAGATLCAAIVVVVPALFVSAWSARERS